MKSRFGEPAQDSRAKSAGGSFLDGQKQFMFKRQSFNKLRIKGLGEARVGDGRRQAAGRQIVGGLETFAKARAEGQKCDPRALAQDASATDRERLAASGHLDPGPFAARIPERDRTFVIARRGCDHVNKFCFVGRRHDDHVRKACEIGDIEGSGVGCAVGADQAGSVNREPHRQILNRDVMHDLIVSTLQERRVDGAEGPKTLRGEAGREGHRVLLGDADIECALRKLACEQIDTGSGWHGGRDGHDPVIVASGANEALAEDPGIGGRVRLRLHLRAADEVECVDPVQLVGRRLCWRVSLALLGDDVHQDRAKLGSADILQNRQQMVEIVSIDWADVVEAELLEQRPAGEEPAGQLLSAPGVFEYETRHLARKLFAAFPKAAINFSG